MLTKNLKKALGAALVTALLLPAAGWAQAYGRVALWVKDAQGDPMQDVKVTATCPELEKYREETKTNKKGLAKIAFVDATKVYEVTFEKPGYVTEKMPIKAELRVTSDHYIVMKKPGDVPAPAADAPRRYTPAEKVFNEGVVLLEANDLGGAKAKFVEALDMNADLNAVYSAIAAVELEQGNLDAAITRAQQFLEREPENAAGYYTLYEAYKQKGETQKADEALAKFGSLDQGGDSAVLLYNEGVEAHKLGQRALAKQRFEAALQADPGLGAAMVGLAQVHYDLGDFQQTVSHAENYLANDPKNYLALSLRLRAYKKLGDDANAQDSMDKLLEHHPEKMATGAYNKGVELFNAGNTNGAIEQFEIALAANPDMAKAHYHLALSYINNNQGPQAKPHLEKFLEIAPEDPDAGTARDMLAYIGK